MKQLGLFLKQKRQNVRLTQATVAKILGLEGPQFISNLERGISGLPVKHIVPIAELYNLEISDLGLRVWQVHARCSKILIERVSVYRIRRT